MVTELMQRVQLVWTTRPWLHWAAAYAIPMGFYSAIKLAALPAVFSMYADLSERSLATAAAGMILAWCEDFVATTLLLATLYVLEVTGRALERFALRGYGSACSALLDVIGVLVHVYVVFVATALWFAPFAADMLLVRTTHIRFSTDLLVAYVRESAMASNLPVSERERQLAVQTVVATVASTFVFTVVYSVWIDLSLWSPTSLLAHVPSFSTANALVQPATSLPLPQVDEKDIESPSEAMPVEPHKETAPPTVSKRAWAILAAAFLCFTLATQIAAWYLVGPTLGAIALNATLEQLSRVFLRSEFQPSAVKAELSDATDYIHSDTEQYSLFQADTLFRRTTGFKGPLAFDVDVDQHNLPNVLVIAVESFRASDSKYLAEAAAVDAALKTQPSVRLTPQFDRWARRNIAFSNMWSSWQTSRSLESILFGQLPLDSVATSGTTDGRADVPLVGMPQFFKQKGYETAFSTGARTDYDQWNKFLPAHGFESVLDAVTYRKLAETHLGVRRSDWQGEAHRGSKWGVHDDLSFEILSVLIETKMKKQAESIRRGMPRHPFFMAHYTISSHEPWEHYPKWFENVELPDFSPLCDGQLQCARIQKYAKLRYFTDMMLGKFLDSLEAKGLLKNMIVVVTGDHGQNPEHDENVLRSEEVDKTRVAGALIAEGRLGKYAGTVIKDAVEHYDLLNTLADIVGVPDEGFLQTSVGRSLKRDAGFGKRLVWSNNPMNKMSVVCGRQRFVYDRLSNAMTLHDTVTDPYEQQDLMPSQSEAQLAEWLAVRTAGRKLNNYFKDRWAGKCLAQVDCHTKKHHGHA